MIGLHYYHLLHSILLPEPSSLPTYLPTVSATTVEGLSVQIKVPFGSLHILSPPC